MPKRENPSNGCLARVTEAKDGRVHPHIVKEKGVRQNESKDFYLTHKDNTNIKKDIISLSWAKSTDHATQASQRLRHSSGKRESSRPSLAT